jgi:hypothetical protein
MCSKSEAQETRGPQAEPIGSALTCFSKHLVLSLLRTPFAHHDHACIPYSGTLASFTQQIPHKHRHDVWNSWWCLQVCARALAASMPAVD